MRLRFYAKHDELVREPGARMIIGQPASYVGRRYDVSAGGWPAVETSHDVESDSEAGLRLTTLCRRDGCLWAADEATAAAVGVPYTRTKLLDGAWVADTTPVAAMKALTVKE
jgi:hypothetical protein